MHLALSAGHPHGHPSIRRPLATHFYIRSAPPCTEMHRNGHQQEVAVARWMTPGTRQWPGNSTVNLLTLNAPACLSCQAHFRARHWALSLLSFGSPPLMLSVGGLTLTPLLSLPSGKVVSLSLSLCHYQTCHQ